MFTNCVIILKNKHTYKKNKKKNQKQTNKKQTNINNFPSNGNSKEHYYEDLSAKSICIHLIAFCACFIGYNFIITAFYYPKDSKLVKTHFS